MRRLPTRPPARGGRASVLSPVVLSYPSWQKSHLVSLCKIPPQILRQRGPLERRDRPTPVILEPHDAATRHGVLRGTDKGVSRARVAIDRVSCRAAVHHEGPVDTFHERNVRVTTYKNIRPSVAKLCFQALIGNTRI